MIFIYPSTGLFEIGEVSSIDKSSARMLHLFNEAWLCRYHRPKRPRFDNSSKFKKNYMPLLKDLISKSKPTLIKILSNKIVERVRQVVRDILRTHIVKGRNFYEIGPWSPIIHDIAYVIHIIYHTTTQVSPG